MYFVPSAVRGQFRTVVMLTPGLAGVGQFGRPPLDSGLKFGSTRGDVGSGRPLRGNVPHPALACRPGSRTTLRVTMPTPSRAAEPGHPRAVRPVAAASSQRAWVRSTWVAAAPGSGPVLGELLPMPRTLIGHAPAQKGKDDAQSADQGREDLPEAT